jgi:hypothetical protein
MKTVNEPSVSNSPGQGDAPESSAASSEPPPEDDQPDPLPGGQSVSELEAKRQAALSASFYHWVLSRL